MIPHGRSMTFLVLLRPHTINGILLDDTRRRLARQTYRFFGVCHVAAFALCCCCCCSHINSHNQARGQRTGSSPSGVEEYPTEKSTKPKVVQVLVHALCTYLCVVPGTYAVLPESCEHWLCWIYVVDGRKDTFDVKNTRIAFFLVAISWSLKAPRVNSFGGEVTRRE